MYLSESPCNLPYFVNTPAPPSSGMAIQFPPPPKGMSGCSCGCGGKCGSMKRSSVIHDGVGNYVTVANPVSTHALQSTMGLGLFDSMDFTTWGVAEWGIVAVGAYLVLSLAGDVGRGTKRVKRSFRRRRAA